METMQNQERERDIERNRCRWKDEKDGWTIYLEIKFSENIL